MLFSERKDFNGVVISYFKKQKSVDFNRNNILAQVCLASAQSFLAERTLGETLQDTQLGTLQEV